MLNLKHASGFLMSLCALLSVISRPVWAVNAIPIGGPIRLTTNGANGHENHPTAVDAFGNSIVVWEEDNGADHDIYAQRYDSDGIMMGSRFRVNVYTPNNQYTPDVAFDSFGNFLIVWNTFRPDLDYPYTWNFGQYAVGLVGARYFPSNYPASPASNEFYVNEIFPDNLNSGSLNGKPSVAGGYGGNFSIAWKGNTVRYDDWSGIYARRYNKNVGLGYQIKVSDNWHTQDYPDVGMDWANNFNVVWAWQENYDDDNIYCRRYGSNGSPIAAAFRVNNSVTTGYQRHPVIGMAANGKSVVAWENWAALGAWGQGSYLMAERYDGSGYPSGTNFAVDSSQGVAQTTPSVDMGNNGDFMIAWSANLGDPGNISDCYARQYSSTGTPQPTFVVNYSMLSGSQWSTQIGVGATANVCSISFINNGDGDLYLQRYH